ncbi:MAG: HDOD domain-containing protein [Bdellovibrionota bacterium]
MQSTSFSTIGTQVGGAQTGFDRRIERVHQHVNKHWIPVNQDLAAKIINGIEEGIYDLDIDFLITDLRSDIGLMLYCMRELSTNLRSKTLLQKAPSNPFEIIRRAGLAQVREVIAACIDKGSRHCYDTSAGFQTDRIGEMLVAASAVEVMAENTELDAELGYSVSLMRQLGMALIAWNYPGLYERAMNAKHHNEDAEDIITMELGISPALLSIRVISEWGLDSDFSKMINSTESEDVGVTMMNSLCEAGEALARANNPNRYPEARQDWERSREFVQDLIGDDAMQMIRRRIKQNSEALFQLVPDRFERVVKFNPDAVIHEEEESRKLFRNPYIKDCPFVLRSKFKELYTRMGPEGIDRRNIAFLINQIIPSAGFSGGLIYIINPASMKLMPQKVFGEINLTNARPIHVGADILLNHPVQLAFSTWDVVDGKQATATAQTHSYIAATLGSRKKAGVVYLEFESSPVGLDGPDHKLHFNAVLHALNEVLNLA